MPDDDQHRNEGEVQDHSPLPFTQHLRKSEGVTEGVGPDLQQQKRFKA